MGSWALSAVLKGASLLITCPAWVILRVFEDDGVAFDERTGDTHHLNLDAARFIAHLKGCDTDGCRITAVDDGLLLSDWGVSIEMIKDLQHAGLIESVNHLA